MIKICSICKYGQEIKGKGTICQSCLEELFNKRVKEKIKSAGKK